MNAFSKGPLLEPRAQQGLRRGLWEATERAERVQSIHFSGHFRSWGVRLVGILGAEVSFDTVVTVPVGL